MKKIILTMIPFVFVLFAWLYFFSPNDVNESGEDLDNNGKEVVNNNDIEFQELKIEDIEDGSGEERAGDGDTVTVHYTGFFEDGTIFDSSIDRDSPFTFTIGEGMVIRGWEEGLIGMMVGGKRKLIIPPHMAYGEYGTMDGSIPPNAILVFEIELLEIN